MRTCTGVAANCVAAFIGAFIGALVPLAPAHGQDQPHAQGLAAGRAAIPTARSAISESSARTVVPGYTTTPAETAYYRQPNLGAQGHARLALCAALPTDPVCQAQTGAAASAATQRPALGASDPAVAGAAAISRSPSSVLDSLASYYSGCTASNCPATVFCLQGSCFDIGSPADPDFARSMSMLEAVREAGVYLDTEHLRVLNGESNRCRDRLLGNCCDSDPVGAGMSNQSLFGTGSRLVYDILMNAENREFVTQGLSAMLSGAGFSGSFSSYGVTVAVNGAAIPAGSVAISVGESVIVAFDPWSLAIAVIFQVVMSAASCDEQESLLAMKEGAGLCHTVGTYCSSCIRVFGSCVSCITHTTRKCCFNSMLARIVNEQGRTQVGRDWGTARRPDCLGFTIDQLQSLDFAAMDLSEFYASLVPTLADVPSLQAQSASRAPSCYYGQGRCQ
jgi:conjugal transfer mating pair stabilization protein TraN